MTDEAKLEQLKKKLTKYRAIFEQKRRAFRGVRHESAVSELRYTEYMVYKSMVEGLEREVAAFKKNNAVL